VLCVDLDGTLVRSDLFAEALCRLLKGAPWLLFLLPFWLLRGRAWVKHEVARRMPIEPATLPWDVGFRTFLEGERAAGRKLILATAADRSHAEAVATHLGLFDEVLASDGRTNCKGKTKAHLLVERCGGAQFTYAGDSQADLAIWAVAAGAIPVNCPPHVEARIPAAKIERRFPPRRAVLPTLIRALRLQQWVKNLLLFVPAVMAHSVSAEAAGEVVIAFLSFGLCASGVYLLNDLLDLEADRHHRLKRFRPFAAGDLPLTAGFLLIPLCTVVGFGVASFFLPPDFVLALAVYLAVTLAYSLRLKQIPVLDVIVLASLYTIRLFAGGCAAGVVVSQWLLGFAMFLFFSLACVKRFSELRVLRSRNETGARGRGYMASDLELVGVFGASSGYLAVLVLALYVSSAEVGRLYAHPERLWLICPVVLYWISRVWLLAHRGVLHDDPIVFAIGDRTSYLAGLCCAGAMVFAMV